MWNERLRPSAVPLPDALDFPHAFGRQVERWNDPSDVDALPRIVLLGLDAATADPVRAALYVLGWQFGRVRIGDVGNLVAGEADTTREVVRALREAGKIVLCIGGRGDQWLSVHAQLSEANPHLRTAWIHAGVPSGMAAVRRWVAACADRDEGLSLIGVQTHFFGTDQWALLDESGLPMVRLSEVRSHPQRAEPLLRDAHLMLCSLSAIRLSESHAPEAWPSGLTVEEVVRLVQYAGLGERMQAACIEGAAPDNALMARAAALVVWYLLEGLCHRRGDYPVTESHLQPFVVHVDDALDLTFFRSKLTGRWWVRRRDGRLVACSEDDYRQSAAGDLPARILRLL